MSVSPNSSTDVELIASEDIGSRGTEADTWEMQFLLPGHSGGPGYEYGVFYRDGHTCHVLRDGGGHDSRKKRLDWCPL